LALNVFHESRGEQVPGQYAVAQVTMRRASYDPDKVCRVVYAKRQFSWTHQRAAKRNPARVDPDAWKRSLRIAEVVLANQMLMDFSKGADHYHATYVRPRWAKHMERSRVLGRHAFYRSKPLVTSEEA
jgi:spore germination cell wall hydrolase CwlJ-like protein